MATHVIPFPVHECANHLCRNRSDEGMFSTVRIDIPEDSHHHVRGRTQLSLTLCSPCANALADIVGDVECPA